MSKTKKNYIGTRSMALLLLNQGCKTPENIKTKIMNLKIELNAPEYDDEGKLLHPEDENECDENNLDDD
jgi:hypothetical protein